ncbi:HTH LytTR-type domain-containing protein [Tenacibaculum sp. 190130A14a]|uniref:HTH LytTR-type domain-containing protein n=1 Tax=Tenacibaculum polynesiense TaxID=3137857 RepID=A0ABM9P6Q1_9FLAO
MKIKQFVNIPFQLCNSKKEKWQYVISCTLFFILFLLIYRPFGILNGAKEHNHSLVHYVLVVFIFATIIFVVLSLSQFIIRNKYSKKKYTIKYLLKWFFIDVSLIVTIITFVDVIVLEEDIKNWQDFFDEVILQSLEIFFSLSIVLLYPVMGTLIYNYIKQLQENKKEIESDLRTVENHYKIASGNEALVKFLDEKNECKLTVPMNAIYAIESQNQYISIQYLKNERLLEQSVRTRFSKALKELEDFPSIIKCHRSYAVNMLNIVSLRYINQKPILILGTEKLIKIPVSKTYLKDIKTKLSLY